GNGRAHDVRQVAKGYRTVRPRYGNGLDLRNLHRQVPGFDQHIIVALRGVTSRLEQYLVLDGLRDGSGRDPIAAQRPQIGLNPQGLIARPVDLYGLHTWQSPQRRGHVGQQCALHLGGGNVRRNLGAIVRHFIDGVAHDLCDGIDRGWQLPACTIDRPVDRLQVQHGRGALAKAQVDFHDAVAHDRAHVLQLGEREKLPFQWIDEKALELTGCGSRQVRVDADLWKVELRQHFHGDTEEGVSDVADQAREHDCPQHGAPQDAWNGATRRNHGSVGRGVALCDAAVIVEVGVLHHHLLPRREALLDECIPAACRSGHDRLRLNSLCRPYEDPPARLIEDERTRGYGDQRLH